MSIYDIIIKDRHDNPISMSEYKGKVLLIVNTATACGFTPQYKDLQAIYEEFKESGLEILDFPCNQFADQAPGDNEEIHTFCTGRFGITFPQFGKVDVNGENQAPLFKWLEENSHFEGLGKGLMANILKGVVKKNDKDFMNNNQVKWNFTKYLIDRNGNLLARFEPTTNMKVVQEEIRKVL